jgi:hypothetical protein
MNVDRCGMIVIRMLFNIVIPVCKLPMRPACA